MTENETKKHAHLGTATLLLILCVLCLVVFSVLSLVTAVHDRKLTDRMESYTNAYYQADSQAQDWVMQTDQTLTKLKKNSSSQTEYQNKLKEEFGKSIRKKGKRIVISFPMQDDQKLSVALDVKEWQDEENYAVQTWEVVNTITYEIDDSMSVYGGE